MSIRMCPMRTMAIGTEAHQPVKVRDGKRGKSMKLYGRHDTQARRHRPWQRHVIVLAIAVGVLSLAWLSFNALIRLITFD